MPERPKGVDSKSTVSVRVPGVRMPLSPPNLNIEVIGGTFCFGADSLVLDISPIFTTNHFPCTILQSFQLPE